MFAEGILKNTADFVRQSLSGAEGGHDWFHTERVYKNALLIAQDTECDRLVVGLGALLHDVADSKFHHGDESIGPRMAEKFLQNQQVNPRTIEAVCDIIANISFKGGNFSEHPKSIELQIVQDADRLDALGAIGIARTFNYGGFKNRPIYDPAIAANLEMTTAVYKNSSAPTLNHFYEKLLLLKDRMNTAKGKALAEKRHQFLETFLAQFYNEWEGRL